MRFLVTGGAGFIGSALANTLVQQGHEVRVVDIGDASRLDERVLFTRGDVSDIPKLWGLLMDVDCVYHLAARVSVPESIRYPADYNRVNVGGTVSVMEAMRDAGVNRVVFASSGAVYGRQIIQPLHEDMTPDPDSPYAVSKFAAETYVRTIGTLWGIETVSLRIFNAYGPGQQLPAVHPPVTTRFLRAAATGESLIVFGDGTQTRDFVYVDDVVAALIAAARAPEIDRTVINVGSGTETAIIDLVTTISRLSGRKIEPLLNTQQQSGVSRMRADLSLAHELLGYQPSTSLEDGLRQTFQKDERFSL